MKFKVFFFFLIFFLVSSKNLWAVETVTDRLYTGQIKDNTGLYYYNARYYDPQLGIFTSADRAQGPNRYGYVGGNPIMRNDPTGNEVPDDNFWNKFWQNTYEKNRDLIDPLVDVGKTWYSGFQDLPWYEKPAVALGLPIMAGAAVFGARWIANPGAVSSYSISQLQAPSSGLGIMLEGQFPSTMDEVIKFTNRKHPKVNFFLVDSPPLGVKKGGTGASYQNNIWIVRNRPEENMVDTAFHELGHIVRGHQDPNTFRDRALERMATSHLYDIDVGLSFSLNDSQVREIERNYYSLRELDAGSYYQNLALNAGKMSTQGSLDYYKHYLKIFDPGYGYYK